MVRAQVVGGASERAKSWPTRFREYSDWVGFPYLDELHLSFYTIRTTKTGISLEPLPILWGGQREEGPCHTVLLRRAT